TCPSKPSGCPAARVACESILTTERRWSGCDGNVRMCRPWDGRFGPSPAMPAMGPSASPRSMPCCLRQRCSQSSRATRQTHEQNTRDQEHAVSAATRKAKETDKETDMQAAIYARVSTQHQERDQTIDSQLAELTRWCEQQRHRIKPEHIFRDE